MTYFLAAQVEGLMQPALRAEGAQGGRAPDVATEASGEASVAALVGWPVAAPAQVSTDDPPANRAKRARAASVLSRRSNLRPAEGSFDAFVKWCISTGSPLEDADELLAQWEWMTDVLATPAAITFPADSTSSGSFAPEPLSLALRTPESTENALALPSLPVAVPDESTPVGPIARSASLVRPVAGRQKLRPHEAAERFVEWVRIAGRCRTYNSPDLTDLYREHCRAEDLVELHESVLRPALQALPGVNKTQSDGYASRKGGKKDRKRYFMWTIEALPVATDDAIEADEGAAPWTPLPMRRVA